MSAAAIGMCVYIEMWVYEYMYVFLDVCVYACVYCASIDVSKCC